MTPTSTAIIPLGKFLFWLSPNDRHAYSHLNRKTTTTNHRYRLLPTISSIMSIFNHYLNRPIITFMKPIKIFKKKNLKLKKTLTALCFYVHHTKTFMSPLCLLMESDSRLSHSWHLGISKVFPYGAITILMYVLILTPLSSTHCRYGSLHLNIFIWFKLQFVILWYYFHLSKLLFRVNVLRIIIYRLKRWEYKKIFLR